MQPRMLKLGACIIIPALIMITPPPPGLSIEAWRLFALYLGAILGLVLRPLPEPAIILAVIGISGVAFGNTGTLLSGYASATAWLVFSAFFIGTAIVETGLGRRIAYNLIARMGRSTLGLGYVVAFTDLVLSPVTPSNTARSGGILFPIVRSLAISLGSTPGETSRRVGAYLTILLYQVSLTTGYMFITALAPNLLGVRFGQDILGINVDWLTWATAALVPGFICLLLAPLLIYWIYPPELKSFDNKNLSRTGLEELGPMSGKEKLLSGLFVLAILAWSTGSITGINATSVAIAFVASCLLFGIVTWDSLASNKGAWTTFTWYGGIISLAGALGGAGFFTWLATLISDNFSFEGINPIVILCVLVFFSLAIRYLFASMATFVTAMIPVFFTIALVADVPAYPVFFGIVFAASYGCLTTHYGGALGPVLFGEGYVDQKTWWLIGAFFAFVSFCVHMAIGLPYWKLLGLW